jgi:hypothetical protein
MWPCTPQPLATYSVDVLSVELWAFSFRIGSSVARNRQIKLRAAYMPEAAGAVSGIPAHTPSRTCDRRVGIARKSVKGGAEQEPIHRLFCRKPTTAFFGRYYADCIGIEQNLDGCAIAALYAAPREIQTPMLAYGSRFDSSDLPNGISRPPHSVGRRTRALSTTRTPTHSSLGSVLSVQYIHVTVSCYDRSHPV